MPRTKTIDALLNLQGGKSLMIIKKNEKITEGEKHLYRGVTLTQKKGE